MFVYSVKSSRLKLILLMALVAAAVAAMLILSDSDTPAANDGGIVLRASDAAERTAFLSQFGWEFEPDPVEVTEIIIPSELDEGYAAYNEIQKAQSLDLSLYAGKRAKRWTYAIKNYPGYEGASGCVQANIIVYEGMVIGGDICSTELDGFVRGFDFPSPETSAPQTTESAETATTASAQRLG